MSMTFDCSGDYFAFHAGKEAPACFHCDRIIEDLAEVRTTSRGRPICKGCFDKVMEEVYLQKEADFKALAMVTDPRETRASNLLRDVRVNIHCA